MSQKLEGEERAGPPRHDPDWKPAGDGRTMPTKERLQEMWDQAQARNRTVGRPPELGMPYGEEKGATLKERVNGPGHYLRGRLETIYKIHDALGPEGFKAFCIGNVIKYTDRSPGKGNDEDLKKAQVYLGWAIHGLPEPVDGRVPR